MDALSSTPRTLADVLAQIAVVHARFGLWHLDDDPSDIPAYCEAGVAELLHHRVNEWWVVAEANRYDLHEFALVLVNAGGEEMNA